MKNANSTKKINIASTPLMPSKRPGGFAALSASGREQE
jgi:hypothetical protein